MPDAKYVDLKGKTWINFCQFSAVLQNILKKCPTIGEYCQWLENMSHNWGCAEYKSIWRWFNIDNYDKCIATLKWIINYNVQLVQSTQTVEKCDIIFIAAGFCFLPIGICCLWYLFYFSYLILCIVVLFSVCIVCDIYYIFHIFHIWYSIVLIFYWLYCLWYAIAIQPLTLYCKGYRGYKGLLFASFN